MYIILTDGIADGLDALQDFVRTSWGKAVGTDLRLGGQRKFCAAAQNFFELHFHIERIRFCTLFNMLFTISTELKAYFILIAIHWFICRYFKTLKFFWLAKYWGGNCPPAPPVPTAMWGEGGASQVIVSSKSWSVRPALASVDCCSDLDSRRGTVLFLPSFSLISAVVALLFFVWKIREMLNQK